MTESISGNLSSFDTKFNSNTIGQCSFLKLYRRRLLRRWFVNALTTTLFLFYNIFSFIFQQKAYHSRSGERAQPQKIWYDEKTTKNPKSVLPEKTADISEFKQLNVLAYILQNVHPSDTTFSLKYKEIAEKTNVSQDTVVRIMRRLRKKKFIRKLHNGVYVVNPYVLVWGPESKRDIIYRDRFKEAMEFKWPDKKASRNKACVGD